jgi:hypothetical protein
MTQKDLRLKYDAGVKDSPFDEHLQIYVGDKNVSEDNLSDVISYIEYLEEEVIELKKQMNL